jgi:hypothetical protein
VTGTVSVFAVDSDALSCTRDVLLETAHCRHCLRNKCHQEMPQL